MVIRLVFEKVYSLVLERSETLRIFDKVLQGLECNVAMHSFVLEMLSNVIIS